MTNDEWGMETLQTHSDHSSFVTRPLAPHGLVLYK
jgi:hypothetical protein